MQGTFELGDIADPCVHHCCAGDDTNVDGIPSKKKAARLAGKTNHANHHSSLNKGRSTMTWMLLLMTHSASPAGNFLIMSDQLLLQSTIRTA